MPACARDRLDVQELDLIEDGLAPVRIGGSEEALRAAEEQRAAR